MTRGSGKSSDNPDRIAETTGGPPVETPMDIQLKLAADRSRNFVFFAGASPGCFLRDRITLLTRRPFFRATVFIFSINSGCILVMSIATNDWVLGMKSTAPISIASSVVSAPLVVSELTISTGVGSWSMIIFRHSKPLVLGISISRVTTWGFNSRTF